MAQLQIDKRSPETRGKALPITFIDNSGILGLQESEEVGHMAWKGRRGLEVNLGGTPAPHNPNYLHELNFRVVSLGMLAKGTCPGTERDKRPGRRKGMKQNKDSFPKLSEARISDPHRRVSGLKTFYVIMSYSRP